MSTPAPTRSTSRPVLIMTSTLAGASVFVSGTAFIDVVPRWVSGLAALSVAAVTVGWGMYTQGLVTPNDAVAYRRLPGGALVPGEAATTGDDESFGDLPGTPDRPDDWPSSSA